MPTNDFSQYMGTTPSTQPTVSAVPAFDQYMQQSAAQDSTIGTQPAAPKSAMSEGEGIMQSIGAGAQQGASNIAAAVDMPGLSKKLEPDQLSQQLMQDYPKSAVVGQAAAYVGAAGTAATGLDEAIGGGASALDAAIGTGLNAGKGVLSSVAANGIVGAILNGPGARGSGFLLGGVGGAVGSAISAVGKFIASNSTINSVFKAGIDKIGSMIDGDPNQIAASSQANVWQMSQAMENKLFDSFRSVPGQIEANPIVTKAANFLHDNADELSPVQQKSVMNLISNTSNAKTLADLHDTRKIFAFDNSKFVDGKPLTGDAYNEFRSLNSIISSVMSNNADKLGVGQQFATANKFYQDTVLPLINTGAKDTADALKNVGTDPLLAAKTTDTLINKFVNPARPETAKAFLNTLDQSGKQAVEVKTIQNIIKGSSDQSGNVDFLKFKNTVGAYQKALGPIFSENTNHILEGLNKTIDEATHIGGAELNLSKMSTASKIYAGAGAVGAIGLGAGYEEGSGGGKAMLTAAGTAAMLLTFHKMLSSPIGQQLLIKAGSTPGRAAAKSLVNGVSINAALLYGDTGNGQSNNNGQQ